MRTVLDTKLPVLTHSALKRFEKKGMSLRQVARMYGVNVYYVSVWANYHTKPTGPKGLEACYRMGLKLRPMLGPNPPPSRLLPAIRKMAATTRAALRRRGGREG